MPSFQQLKRSAQRESECGSEIRVAVLADLSTQWLTIALRGVAVGHGVRLAVFEGDFGQVETLVFDADSQLYAHKPEFVLIAFSAEQFLVKYQSASWEDRRALADQQVDLARNLWSHLRDRLDCKILHATMVETLDPVFGHFGSRTPESFAYQVRKHNLGLCEAAAESRASYIIDLALLHSLEGRAAFFDPRDFALTKSTIALTSTPTVAEHIFGVIRSLRGEFKKCLIVDLDNTLWGGVVGDDGLEGIELGHDGVGAAYLAMQRWAKSLKDRGVLLAVCSKNDEERAKEPFERHPDMALRLDDIAVFVANWENKADNIRFIQSVLDIGFDSLVFVDDSPFERNLVRERLPEVTVPELPEDPAFYVEFLQKACLFETSSFSGADQARTTQYQTEALRRSSQRSFTTIDDYLQSLEMRMACVPYDRASIARVAQLTQRSNQFNLRTCRYTEGDVERLAASDRHQCFAFRLADKFGDHGIICVVILVAQDANTYFVDTWLMSCRVLNRGVERGVLNAVVRAVAERGGATLVGEYLPTRKNDLVKDFYRSLEFNPRDGLWTLDVESYKERKTFIREEQ